MASTRSASTPATTRKLKPSEFESTCTECNRFFRLVDQYADHLVMRDRHLVCLTEDEQYPLTQCIRCGGVFRRNQLNAHWAEQAIKTIRPVPGKHHTRTRGSRQLWYANPCVPATPRVSDALEPVDLELEPAELTWRDLKDQACDQVDPEVDW